MPMELLCIMTYNCTISIRGDGIMFAIGLVGPFGSGCTYIGKWIQENREYVLLSLSDELRTLFKEAYPKKKATRKELQNYGDHIRKTHGGDYLAKLVWEKIQTDTTKNYIIDSIRNPDEISFFRRHCASFYLFGVFAEPDVRWKRVHDIYGVYGKSPVPC